MKIRALVMLVSLFDGAALRAETTFTSGPAQTALIELYTSEGCSSCPPAEKWLGELRSDARLWKEFVPVAFHVNYWDRLGWRDVFASRAFTDRQYAYARIWRGSSVYTPCFVRNGEEWRSRDLAAGERREAGVLSVGRRDDGSFSARLQPSPGLARGDFEIHVALLGAGVTSEVRAGENAGRKLAHDFVALTLRSGVLVAGADGVLTADLEIVDKGLPATPRRAIAAWVTRRGELAPLQATGGWLN